MRESTVSLSPQSTRKIPSPAQEQTQIGDRRKLGLLFLFLVVWGAQFAFGMWMNSRGFVWPDSLSRAANALYVLHSADPKLAAIGFVWMPLPSLVELLWVVLYPVWPAIVASGLVSSLTTALAGGATAALLLYTARTLRLPEWLGWVFALLVATNPMVFLYAGNGLSEGVAAPFLTGTVCFLVLFWASGRRRYVTAAALALALGFASLYEAVPYGAALFAALLMGLLWGSREENVPSAPQGRWRAVQGLGTLLLLPSLYVAVLWVGANAVIMDDPLFFMHSQYSNHGQTAAVGGGGLALQVAANDLGATLLFVLARATPFLIPVAALIVVRALDGRFFRTNTLALLLLSLVVQFGLITPFIYQGLSFGWLRFFMYPLFVAAGWGLYEVAQSRNRTLAATLVLVSWLITAPVTFWAMAHPTLGQEESKEVTALLSGKQAEQVGYYNPIEDLKPVAQHLEEVVFPENRRVVVDSFEGWPVATSISPSNLKRLLIVTPDHRFKAVLESPRSYDVTYFLVPNPDVSPQDAINRRYPKLWAGAQPGFELVERYPAEDQHEWRLYQVVSRGSGELERNKALLSSEANPEQGGPEDVAEKAASTGPSEAAYFDELADIQNGSVETSLRSNDELLRYDRLTADDVQVMKASSAALKSYGRRAKDLDPPAEHEEQHEVFVLAINELRDANELAYRLAADPLSASQTDFEAYDRYVERATAYLRRSNEMLGGDYKTTEGAQRISLG